MKIRKTFFVVLIVIISLFVYAYGVEPKSTPNKIITEDNLNVYSISAKIKPQEFENFAKQIYQDKLNEEAEQAKLEAEREKQLDLEQINSSVNLESGQRLEFLDETKNYSQQEKDLLAKMLFCENRGASRDIQIITLSAIINHIDYNGGFWVLDDENHFSPAPFYRDVQPTQLQYDIVDYVCNNHIIKDVKYFRTSYYHNFATNVCNSENTFFSK